MNTNQHVAMAMKFEIRVTESVKLLNSLEKNNASFNKKCSKQQTFKNFVDRREQLIRTYRTFNYVYCLSIYEVS